MLNQGAILSKKSQLHMLSKFDERTLLPFKIVTNPISKPTIR